MNSCRHMSVLSSGQGIVSVQTSALIGAETGFELPNSTGRAERKAAPSVAVGNASSSAKSQLAVSGLGYREEHDMALFPIALRHRGGFAGGVGGGQREARHSAKCGRPGALHGRRDAAVQ